MNLDYILAAQLSVLDSEFSPKRIYEDFWSYLSSATDSIEVEAVFETETKIDVLISKDDPITVLSKVITHGHPNLTFFPLVVHVAIGRFEITSGLYKTSKCSAELLYNSDLELIDVDFSVWEAHKLVD